MNPVLAAPAFGPAAPEILLAIGALVLLMVGAFRRGDAAPLVNAGALVLLAVALLAVLRVPSVKTVTFGGAFITDGFAKVMKVLTLLGSAAGLVLSRDFFRREGIDKFEFPILVLLATVGMLMMISANDLIALYIGLELLSLSSYVIASFHRDNLRSTEAGLKYFVLGALSSGMLLYGASLIYGFTGTISFPAIANVLRGEAGLGVILGLVFVSAGVAFKISAAPFHMWTPDVYEGAPTPVSAFFAAAPKMAAMALAVRVFIGAFPTIIGQWQQIIIFIAIVSMVIGSFAAIGQRNIKRLMAYSSIGNVGYALIGLAAGTPQGIQGVIVYMTTYLAMTLGAFACILAMRRRGVYLENIDDLSGLGRTSPALAFCLAAMMWSLAGIPIFAGFFAKLQVFSAAIQAGLYALAVIGVVTSVVGAYYYLRITKIIYFDEPREAFDPAPLGIKLVLGATSAFVVLFGLPFIAAPVIGIAGAAARSLF
ncbi:MAG TPA: NADH-quinone oxidoreductase subunit NuoN [Beijerinckiaceae bacterium]|jgi:NADH-quinone oxidoreductase subunit N